MWLTGRYRIPVHEDEPEVDSKKDKESDELP
jgi:endogenous inhibitor of DNA gyrase (YacG/DUF329 family)